jgi:hypothetical protein
LSWAAGQASSEVKPIFAWINILVQNIISDKPPKIRLSTGSGFPVVFDKTFKKEP